MVSNHDYYFESWMARKITKMGVDESRQKQWYKKRMLYFKLCQNACSLLHRMVALAIPTACEVLIKECGLHQVCRSQLSARAGWLVSPTNSSNNFKLSSDQFILYMLPRGRSKVLAAVFKHRNILNGLR